MSAESSTFLQRLWVAMHGPIAVTSLQERAEAEERYRKIEEEARLLEARMKAEARAVSRD